MSDIRLGFPVRSSGLFPVLAGLAIAAILVFPPTPATGGILLSEDFEGAVSGQDRGGSYVPLGQGDGKGWQSDLRGKETGGYLTLPVVEGVDYSTERGTLEFWLKNDRLGGEPYKKADTYYDTVLEWIGQGWYLPIYFLGHSDRAEDESALVVWGHRYVPSANPYGTYIHLGRRIALGEWIHVAFTWGPEPADNALYVNGKPFPLDLPVAERVNFGPQLQGAHTLVIGADLMDASSPGGIYHLANAVVDDLKVHDDVVTTFDLSRLVPVIRSVSHNALAAAGISGRLVAGGTVTVTLRAPTGGTASFDLGAGIAGIVMAEDRTAPGTYVGTYTVRPGDFIEDGAVTGRFTSAGGMAAEPLAAPRPVNVDGTTHLAVRPSNDLVPADRASRSGLTVVATDANGKAVREHQLKLSLSTTDDYTGTVGGGSFEEAVGGSLEVDWRGVTDSFGEVTAQYVSGFAAKTILLSAKDMVSGDVGVGWVRSYIDGTVDIVVKRPEASALAFAGTMEITASRAWLTADGKSRSRITAVVKDEAGIPMAGHNIDFSLAGDNGSLRVVQSRTDGKGRSYADYVAGTVMGQVTIEVRDLTSGLSGAIVIELRPDAPAEVKLIADSPDVLIGGGGTTVTATVKDINGNPNEDVDVVYDIASGEGSISAPTVATDGKGRAAVLFTPGEKPGTVTIRGTVTSRAPTPGEISAAEGAVFLYGLVEDPGELTVSGWMAKAGDEVVDGQDLVVLADRHGVSYTVKSPRDGKVSAFVAEEGDEVNYGDTLGYVLVLEKK